MALSTGFGSAIVPGYSHVAATFTFVALLVGRAVRPVGSSGHRDETTRATSGVPCLFLLRRL